MFSLLRFLPYMKYVFIVIALLLTVYLIYDIGFYNGSNEQKVKCDKSIRLIEKSVYDANMIELNRAELQVKAYNKALVIQQEKYNDLKAARKRDDIKIKELKNENKNWSNTAIPDDIINWLQR